LRPQPFATLLRSLTTRAPVRKGNVHRTTEKNVPSHIARPSYAVSGATPPPERTIEVKQQDAITKMRAACKLAREALTYSGTLVQAGVSTEQIDVQVHEFICARNAYPSPINYMGFPRSICTSVNEVICHGIPDDRPLEDGDMVKVANPCVLW